MWMGSTCASMRPMRIWCLNLKHLNQGSLTWLKFPALGTQSEGKPIVYIRISNNVTAERPLKRPMFKYIGNMHGDETVGRQILIYLAHYLLNKYGKNERVTRLVDNIVIFIMPSLNPDGYSRSRQSCLRGRSGWFNRRLNRLRGRRNANGKDLNRNFPEWSDENKSVSFQRLSAGREPETR